MHRPEILAFLETNTSGRRADEVCTNIGYKKWFLVKDLEEVFGFSGTQKM